jgi:hypothetical protein
MEAVLLGHVSPGAVDAVAVTVTGPAPVQTKVGDDEEALRNVPVPVPPVTAQEKVTEAPLGAIADAASAIEPPTSTADGLAESDVRVGHAGSIVVVPVIATDPRLPASTRLALQTRWTATGLVACATMPNAVVPTQERTLGGTVVAAIVIV